MKSMWKWIFAIVLIAVLFSPLSYAQETDPKILLEKMDRVLRGQSHDMTVSLDVETKSWKRHYDIQVWMKGTDFAFARVLAPQKVAGQGFLRIKSRLWNYLPTAERTMLIPPSLMLDRFLGSDFSNDDFVKLSYLPRDYDAKIVGEETRDQVPLYHLELIPHADAPVTYGKLEIWLRQIDAGPVQMDFFNEHLEHIRTLFYSEYKAFGSHEAPTVWQMQNNQDESWKTKVTIQKAEFDTEIADRIFTRENLEKAK